MSEPICDVCGSEVGVKISDLRAIAEMIAKFRTPPDCSWTDLANDIETVLKSERERCAKLLGNIATGLRRDARNTRENWCGKDVGEEDRRANYRDAREREQIARTYDAAAAAIRAVPLQQQEVE